MGVRTDHRGKSRSVVEDNLSEVVCVASTGEQHRIGLGIARSAGLLGAALAAAIWVAPVLAADPAGLSVELNKLETQDKGCRAYVVVNNAGATAYRSVKLDLVLFQPDGIIGKRFAVDLAPLKPQKRTVKLFDSKVQLATRSAACSSTMSSNASSDCGPLDRLPLRHDAQVAARNVTTVEVRTPARGASRFLDRTKWSSAADPVVKGVMLLLVLASVACWAIVFEKAFRMLEHEPEVDRLDQADDRKRKLHCTVVRVCPMRFSRPLVEKLRKVPRAAKSRGEVRARLERAMRARSSPNSSASKPACRSSPPSARRRRSSACSARSGAS